MHEELKGTGVSVTVLCPGFTHTEFQERANAPASDVPGFMWQEAPEVARAGLDGLAKNRAVVIPGAINKVMGNLSAVTPHAITRRLGARGAEARDPLTRFSASVSPAVSRYTVPPRATA